MSWLIEWKSKKSACAQIWVSVSSLCCISQTNLLSKLWHGTCENIIKILAYLFLNFVFDGCILPWIYSHPGTRPFSAGKTTKKWLEVSRRKRKREKTNKMNANKMWTVCDTKIDDFEAAFARRSERKWKRAHITNSLTTFVIVLQIEMSKNYGFLPTYSSENVWNNPDAFREGS